MNKIGICILSFAVPILILTILLVGYNCGSADRTKFTDLGLFGYAEMYKPVTTDFLNQAILISMGGQPDICAVYDIKLSGQWYRVWTNASDENKVIQIKKITEYEHENEN